MGAEGGEAERVKILILLLGRRIFIPFLPKLPVDQRHRVPKNHALLQAILIYECQKFRGYG
jgi:hypothetical protein